MNVRICSTLCCCVRNDSHVKFWVSVPGGTHYAHFLFYAKLVPRGQVECGSRVPGLLSVMSTLFRILSGTTGFHESGTRTVHWIRRISTKNMPTQLGGQGVIRSRLKRQNLRWSTDRTLDWLYGVSHLPLGVGVRGG